MTDLYIARGPRLAARVLASETVILKADDSGLYVLNEVGTLLWGAADGTTPLATIVERLICPRFDVVEASAPLEPDPCRLVRRRVLHLAGDHQGVLGHPL